MSLATVTAGQLAALAEAKGTAVSMSAAAPTLASDVSLVIFIFSPVVLFSKVSNF
jgi:hypothetical protein